MLMMLVMADYTCRYPYHRRLKTHIDQKEDIPDFCISTDGQESEESKDEDQTVE